jgi:hypothetical protein
MPDYVTIAANAEAAGAALTASGYGVRLIHRPDLAPATVVEVAPTQTTS